MKYVQLLFAFFLFSSFCLSPVFSQMILYPEEATRHYQALIDYQPSTRISVQEWRRPKGEGIQKGMRFDYNDKGQIESIKVDDSEQWTYSYTPQGKIRQINCQYVSGKTTINYRYTPEYVVREVLPEEDAPISERTYYYYNAQGGIAEETYFAWSGQKHLVLQKRIVRTFMGETEPRVKAEMYYDHSLANQEKNAIIRQWKVVYHYHPETKKLLRKDSYRAKTMKGRAPYKSSDFTEVVQQVHSYYDAEGKKLIKKVIADPTGAEIEKEVHYFYHDGQLREVSGKNYDTGIFKKEEYNSDFRQFFTENGRLQSYFYTDGVFDESFRSSFTVRELE